MNSFVFIAQASIAYETTQVIGVFSTINEALARCQERVYMDECCCDGLPAKPEDHPKYDRHWVEEWTLDGGYYIRTHDVVDGKVVREHV